LSVLLTIYTYMIPALVKTAKIEWRLKNARFPRPGAWDYLLIVILWPLVI
jgi:hypothetical protein